MKKNKLLTGTIKRHPDGFGFFIPDDKEHPDVYIPRQSMRGVMTTDKIEIEVFPERGGERFRGEVVRVIEHGTKKIVGRFFRLNNTTGIIRDEGNAWGEDLKIKISESMDAKEKELVAAEILTYPENKQSFTGKVVQIIGDAQDPMNDIKRVLATHNIPVEFSPSTLVEAKRFKDQPEEKDFKDRKDLRAINLITIDGATAKDFDDAVYVEGNKSGFKLYVAIADVSHYVTVGSAIDKDAFERGTSVYFPNYVVPMLPEVLSNGLCSLNPHVNRLCLVAEMQMDFAGEMLSSSFYEAVMESKARITYGEAQEVIDGNDVEKLRHVRDGILRLADLAKILMAKRFKEGSLDLEIPETELLIDGAGVPIDIIRSQRLFAHRLIEEMMLAANVAVGKFLSNKEIPALYRIHEPPNELAIKVLEKYMQTFGGTTKLEGGKLQRRLTKALEEFSGKPESQVLNILTLRSMSQAKYSKENVGHFGLGFDFYTHFTSPIRRYPDLIVHRLIKSLVMKGSTYSLMTDDDLATAGTMLSASEQRSVKAERQVQSIKKARFMEKLLGQELDGMVSSVAKFGLFVLLREYDIDGLIRLDDLHPGERFEFDEENLRLVGSRSNFSYNIGDNVRVQVAAVDVEAGQINFVLAGSEEKTTAQTSAGRFLNKLRGKDQDQSRRKSRSKESSPKNTRAKDTHTKDDRKSFSKKKTGPAPAAMSAKAKTERSSGGRSTDSKNVRPNERREERRSEGSDRRGPRKDSGPKPGGFMSRTNFRQDSPKDGNFAKPGHRESAGPNEDLLKMILGPDEYKKAVSEKDKPKPSKKLAIAETSKHRFNKDIVQTEQSNDVATKSGKPNRQDAQKRGQAEDDRGSVRKTRPSQRRGKGKAR